MFVGLSFSDLQFWEVESAEVCSSQFTAKNIPDALRVYARRKSVLFACANLFWTLHAVLAGGTQRLPN